MLCYPCAKNGVERQAVTLCTSCSAGLCHEHLRETTQLASDNPFAGCHHDTWAAQPPAARARAARRTSRGRSSSALAEQRAGTSTGFATSWLARPARGSRGREVS